MATFEEHCRDCQQILGDRCEKVNRWMDEWAAKYGPLHRFVRHHTRGVEEAGWLFGELGRKAAIVHVLKDCGHIPTARMWVEQKVDSLGMIPADHLVGLWDPQKFVRAAKNLIGA